MTSIKTIIEGFTLVLLIVLGILLFNYSASHSVGKIFSSLPNFNYLDLKWEIITLISSTLGCYFYLFKNTWINFKSRNVIGILIATSITLLYSSVAAYFSILKFQDLLLSNFNEIPFPIEEDFVTKNINLSIIHYVKILLLLLFATGLTGLVLGNIQLLLFRKRFPKKQ